MMQPKSITIESHHNLAIPGIDVASFIFSSGTETSRRKPQYFDATNPSKCFSLAQAEVYVKQVAHGLQRLGLKPDDKVLLYSRNSLFFPILLWGVIASGCVFTACAPSASASELKYQIQNSEAKLILTHPEIAHTALKAASDAGRSKNTVYLFTDPGEDMSKYSSLQLRPWNDIWSTIDVISLWTWKKISSVDEAKATTAILNYSSGTTGLPKGVELSHYNLVANSLQMIHKRSIVGDTPSASARKERLDRSGERWLAPLPTYHAYGQTYYCMSAARLGAKVFIMPKYNVNQFLLYLDIYRITFMTSVPVIMTTLTRLKNPGMYNLKAVESVVTGSAPLNPEIGRIVEQLYLHDGVKIKQGYGMTECTCSVSGFAPDDKSDGTSVGSLNANCRAKIVEIEGRDFTSSTPPGVVTGEIWISGPNVMRGYYKMPNETANAMVHENGDSWFRTGDIGYVDKRGCIYIVDRLKELIKVKGLQVAPAELELALLTHPDVADAAVVGVKTNDGEYPRAFVVRKENVVSELDLENLIKERFARHKWLTAGVFFIEEIPRTGNGKITRRNLPSFPHLPGAGGRNKL